MTETHLSRLRPHCGTLIPGKRPSQFLHNETTGIATNHIYLFNGCGSNDIEFLK